jgi:ATP-binding protein involved in chromosome partitioning
MPEPLRPAQWNHTRLDGVDRVIAIASGKGGVGKSTLTVLLAYQMQQMGQKIGILDADIYGPSIPRMLGLQGKPDIKDDKMIPLERNGIVCNSMGFLLEEAQAAIWRGPMITKALHQLARLTHWGKLNTLLVDMPPGTGDIHLSMVQQVPLDGVILITTPQEIALLDARKAADMFRKVNIPILGVIENMSWFEDNGRQKHLLFGEGGGAKLAAECGAPLLAKLPLSPALTQALDTGRAPAEDYLGYIPMI